MAEAALDLGDLEGATCHALQVLQLSRHCCL